MVVKIYPAVDNRIARVIRRGLHAPQAPKYVPHLAQVKTRQGRFDPFQRVYRLAILGFRHLVEVLGTVVIVEHLTRLREHRLDLLPDPLGPIADDAQPHGVLGNQSGIFDLVQGFAHIVVAVHLMPAEHMHDALAIEEIEAKPLGFAPLVVPPGPSGALPCLARAPASRTVGARRDIGPINPQDQYRTAKASGSDLRDAPINLLPRWRHLQHIQALSHLLSERVHALTTDGNATEPPKEPRGRLIQDFGSHIHGSLLDVRLHATHTYAQYLVKRIGPRMAARTIEVGPRKLDSPYHRLDTARHRTTGGQPARTGGTRHRLPTLFLGMRLMHNRLRHPTGQLLP